MKTELELEIEHEENLLFNDRKNLKIRETSVIQKKSVLREDTVVKQFSLFINKQAKSTQNSVYLNLVLLQAAIKSYYRDIHRYKDFSGSEWANKHKQAAYTIKWLVKFRPIQIKQNTQNVTEEIFDINLKFALVCGFSFLGNKVTDLIMKNRECFYDALLYDLRYRQLSGKKLILAFEALELAAK